MALFKYSAPQFTTAQLVLMACGVDDLRLQAHHHEGPNKSHTKRGPGRCHTQGTGDYPNAKISRKTGGSMAQHNNPVKNAIRKEKRVIGRRQWLIGRKSERASARLAEVMPHAFQDFRD